MKTKNIFLATVLWLTADCLFPNFSFTQSPNWAWAKRAGGISWDEAQSVTIPQGGTDILVAGFFKSDTITFGSTNLLNAGSNDIFLVRYNTSGNVLWAKSAGGSSDDAAYSVATDANGNILVTGYFKSPTITFGSTTLTNSGNFANMFIVKYDGSGNVLWAKSAGGSSDEKAVSVAIPKGGTDILVTGVFGSSTVVFGSATVTNTNSPYLDIFLAKYDASGNVLWAKSAGSSFLSSSDLSLSVAADANGNVLLAGNYERATITFGSTTLTNAGISDMFVAKYDASGNVLWAKRAGGSLGDRAYSVTADANGNVVVAGFFNSTSITFGTTTFSGAGLGDLFLAKYDASGNVLWAKHAGGAGKDVARSVIILQGGTDILMIGHFTTKNILFGSFTLTDTNSPYEDIFLARYDASGNVLWAKSAGGIYNSYHDVPLSVAVDANSNILLTGYFDSFKLNFPPTSLNNAGGAAADMFLAKLGTVTGVNEWSNEESFSVYPNPTSGKFTVAAGDGQLANKKEIEIEIYNVLGECIHQHISTFPPQGVLQTNFQIDLSNQLSGVYFVQIKTEQGAISKKIIIQK